MEYNSECVKLVVDLQAQKPIESIDAVPATFNPAIGQYVWKQFADVEYAIVPRSIENDVARVDLFMEMDEDDMDDIDIPRFVRELLIETLTHDPAGTAPVASAPAAPLNMVPAFTIKWISEPEEWVEPVDVRHGAV